MIAASKSERRWSSDPLRGNKRRLGSKLHFRPKTTYIDSTSFDFQALDAGISFCIPLSLLRALASHQFKPTKSSKSSCLTEIPPHVIEKMKTKAYHFIGVDALLSK
ncbi:unnamed protein product [Porites lobata]|uniref:Uncharacterized protein n=1 Tax=Porites lobata TaxID=104759 RepID=A0ABN8P1V2_9CNID|nr:unnamed protein product [Porites lobata]